VTQAIEITNLAEFQAAVLKSVNGIEAALHKGAADAGKPILAHAQELSPSTRVAAAGRISVSGAEGSIIFQKDWAEVSEWSKKPGWMAYGAPGRYGYKAVRERADEAQKVLDKAMEDVITLQGWVS
jgi:hypothetical protein